jgi:hypothetical protein
MRYADLVLWWRRGADDHEDHEGDPAPARAGGRRAIPSGRQEDKERILTEFVATTGYHRKHAIRILNDARARLPESAPPIRLRPSDQAVREALLPTLVAALERHGHMQLDDAVRRSLLVISPATIDRADHLFELRLSEREL